MSYTIEKEVIVGGIKAVLKKELVGNNDAGIYLAESDGFPSFFHFGMSFPSALTTLNTKCDFYVEDSKLLVCPRVPLKPLTNEIWMSLPKLTIVDALFEFVQEIGKLHDQNIWIHGVRKNEIYWDAHEERLVLIAFPRVRETENVGEEAVWRDFKVLSLLLYEGFQKKKYPGGHEIASWLQDRDRLHAEDLSFPGLTQFLAGAVSPYGDLAFTDWKGVQTSLNQIQRELSPVCGFRVGQHSTVGNYIFRKNNQDSCGYIQLGSICGSEKKQSGFFCVADGIGGIDDGERASGLAIETTCNGFARTWAQYGTNKLAENPTLYARLIAKNAGQTLAMEGEFAPASNRGGTTLSGMVIARDRAGICHVGDSRIVLVRDGILYRLTDDHTLANILLKLGEQTPEEIAADDLAQRTISRFLSTSMEVEFDRIDDFGESAREIFHEINTHGYLQIHKRDVFIFTSDGAHGETDDDGISAIVMENREDPQVIAEALTQNAVARFGKDNSTVLVVLVV